MDTASLDIIWPWQMWVVFATIALAMTVYAWERIALEITSLSVIAGLIVFFHAFPITTAEGAFAPTPAMLLAGFGNPALITVLALLVIGQALFVSEALETPAQFLGRAGGKTPRLALFGALAVVFIISAFLNNTPVAVMFIPVLTALAAQSRALPSQIMMPLSFTCILGGMLTLIGSSTNLLAAQSAEAAGAPPLGFFTITIPGLMLAVPGFIYVLFVMPRLLPKRSGTEIEPVGDGRQYIAQIELDAGHRLIGTQASAGLFEPLKDMTVLMIQRGEEAILPPFEDITLRYGDIVIVAATREVLALALKDRDGVLGAMARAVAPGDTDETTNDVLRIVEAIVAPASRMLGRNIEQVGFRRATGCIVLGIQRRSRMIRAQMADIRLEAGDVLLLLGPPAAQRHLGHDHDIMPLQRTQTDIARTHPARAIAVFAATIITAASGLLPIVAAALAGAAGMIVAGVINIRQAARAIDRRIFLLICAALAMATALETTGGAAFLASAASGSVAGAEPVVLLSVFFLVVALTTNILSNNATAVLFAPVAVNTAQALNLPTELFIVTLILAANCSFATPIAYQTNLLVMGPGHYRFSDYLRAGAPLVLLLWAVYTFLIPRYYGL